MNRQSRPQKIASYDPSKIEKKWQKKWASSKVYKSQERKVQGANGSKYYVLDMFPYPSGEGLHVGHPKGYIATDIVSRMHRMQGKNVLHPMGFDAFGLPAENYAIKMKMDPAVAMKKNVARFKKQLEIIGLDYDWSREVNTTDPAYYKWTQWAFLQMYKKGLAYESNEPVNWCPKDKTVLANEDVENGLCERCGTPVEKKPMRQWVLKITDYADRLLADLDATDGSSKPLLDWPESIKEAQRNWIGRSEGAEIDFKIKDSDKVIKVFTTRPDTLFGVTYLVLAPEHPWVKELLPRVSNKAEVEVYISKTQHETEIERTDAKRDKTGVELKGVKAVNPANGEEVPVWIADYVLADYGTGAVMAVPAHDERDWEFAKKFGLPIRHVVVPERKATTTDIAFHDGESVIKRNVIRAVVKHWSEDKYLVLNWNEHGWKTFISGGIEDGESFVEAAVREIREETGYKNISFIGEIGGPIRALFYAPHKDQNRIDIQQGLLFKLKDGEQIEVSEDEHKKHTAEWLPFSKASEIFNATLVDQVLLARIDNHQMGAYTDSGVLIHSGEFDDKASSIAMKDITAFAGGRWVTRYKLRDWVFSRQRYWGEPIPLVHCEKCGVVPVPEKELPVKLPKVNSYEPTGTGESPLAAISKWVNVKCPKCGGKGRRETNTMPQWAGSCWYYLRYEDPKNKKALVDPKKEKYWSPVDLYVGGAEHATRHLIYARFWHKFLKDIGVVSTIEPFTKLQSVGLIMGEDGRKMSKRFGNVVNPDDIVARFGADTLRVYEMFMGPFDQSIAWSTDSIVGARRFIERVWKLVYKAVSEYGSEGTRAGREGGRAQALDQQGQTAGSREAISDTASRTINKAIKKVTDDIDGLRFNTAISALMIAANELEKLEAVDRASFETYLKLLAPFAPHVAEELWAALGNKKSIHISPWPQYDPTLAVEEERRIIIQINGKVRGSFMAKNGATDAELGSAAKQAPEARKWLDGKDIKKMIVVPGRLVNFVIG
ncbi:MAG: leucine--tRNA ligase [Patescibacteria group bacterium]|nr:leucine--tRNA ligase [Patescibacteria group bacterium]